MTLFVPSISDSPISETYCHRKQKDIYGTNLTWIVDIFKTVQYDLVFHLPNSFERTCVLHRIILSKGREYLLNLHKVLQL